VADAIDAKLAEILSKIVDRLESLEAKSSAGYPDLRT